MSFTVLGAVIVLTYYVVTSREDHRERGVDFVTVRGFLGWTVLPALALGLLSLGTLVPISEPLDKALSWIAFAILLAWVGIPMWEYHRERDQHVKGS